MTVEHARTHTLPKPWGVSDLSPFSSAGHDGGVIGEIWYERAGKAATDPSLLLKLLFTSQPLSIQVHPDDAYAQSIGLPNGKTEAWYVLSATPEAKVALGLAKRLTPQQLREAVEDGSISGLVAWHAVWPGDAIFVPAGTIHAIGAGLVIAEVQQRSDTTFRLFDHGRARELDVENAVAAADAGPADIRGMPSRLSDTRTLLNSNPYFTFEKIDLAPNSAWCLEAEQETWLLVVGGCGSADSFDIATGDAVFAQSDRIHILVGPIGLVGLVAYTGVSPVPDLLQSLGQADTGTRRPHKAQAPTSLTRARSTHTGGSTETTQ